jgi:hypothetical protein
MNAKDVYLCLILILVSTWTERLKDGSFLVAPPTGASAFGQEICPRGSNRETVDMPQLARINKEPFVISTAAPMDIRSRLAKAISHLISGADACYLLMSLQR